MSVKTTSPKIASQLDRLPLELIEPVISQLSIRDALSLLHNVDKGSHLWNAFDISPSWKDIWPMITENWDDFHGLAALNININGHILDLTDGALDGTPKSFRRNIAKRQARLIEANVDSGSRVFQRNFFGLDFFQYEVLKASENLTGIIRELEDHVLAFVCHEFSPDVIASIVPWLSKCNPSDTELRSRFWEYLQTSCPCNEYRPPSNAQYNIRWNPTLTSRHMPKGPTPRTMTAENWAMACEKKHPTRPTAHWNVSQAKVFVTAYTEVQKKLNAAKADQLRELSKIYERHHARLKEPLAPQTPRSNHQHIPQQLRITAQGVDKIIDLYKSAAAWWIKSRGSIKTQAGTCRFHYPHACLIPYDWCLRLWMKVVVGVEGAEDIDISHAPEHILRNIDVVKKGMNTYFIFDGKGKEAGELIQYDDKIIFEGHPRTKIRVTDGTPAFAVHQETARTLRKMRSLLTPARPEEVEWLVAFLEVIEWIEGEYLELATEIKAAGADAEDDFDIKPWVRRTKKKKGPTEKQLAQALEKEALEKAAEEAHAEWMRREVLPPRRPTRGRRRGDP
ncbi:hypothetical protein QBC43DRAFT_243833 [Cladorrhinum sp. PSN259]|nr:hypothetical protein QBC43DRAFT_243833 [Cladorrhinum sp. PSN259]